MTLLTPRTMTLEIFRLDRITMVSIPCLEPVACHSLEIFSQPDLHLLHQLLKRLLSIHLESSRHHPRCLHRPHRSSFHNNSLPNNLHLLERLLAWMPSSRCIIRIHQRPIKILMTSMLPYPIQVWGWESDHRWPDRLLSNSSTSSSQLIRSLG